MGHLGSTSKNWRILAILLATIPLAVVAAWAPFGIYRYVVYRESLLVQAPEVTFEYPENLLVMLRGRERMFQSEEEIPFRNTPTSLFVRQGDKYVRRSDTVLMARSTATSGEFPKETDLQTVHNVMMRSASPSPYSYGYESIPAGIYILQPTEWRNGDPAFSISSFGAPPGIVVLETPQTVRHCAVEYDANNDPVALKPLEGGQFRTFKQGCYLHPSVTRFWSHVDSNGCINFQRPPESLEGSDYGRFLDLIARELGSHNPDSFGLLIIDEETYQGASEDSSIPIALSFVVQGFKVGWNSLELEFET